MFDGPGIRVQGDSDDQEAPVCLTHDDGLMSPNLDLLLNSLAEFSEDDFVDGARSQHAARSKEGGAERSERAEEAGAGICRNCGPVAERRAGSKCVT